MVQFLFFSYAHSFRFSFLTLINVSAIENKMYYMLGLFLATYMYKVVLPQGCLDLLMALAILFLFVSLMTSLTLIATTLV